MSAPVRIIAYPQKKNKKYFTNILIYENYRICLYEQIRIKQ